MGDPVVLEAEALLMARLAGVGKDTGRWYVKRWRLCWQGHEFYLNRVHIPNPCPSKRTLVTYDVQQRYLAEQQRRSPLEDGRCRGGRYLHARYVVCATGATHRRDRVGYYRYQWEHHLPACRGCREWERA